MELVISDIKIRLIYCNTYNIARQSVVDKMVREISLEVREKSGKSQGILLSHFCGNPELCMCMCMWCVCVYVYVYVYLPPRYFIINSGVTCRYILFR